MSEPKALRIVIPWVVIGRVFFIGASLFPLWATYFRLFPHWTEYAISELTVATFWCAYASWLVAGGRIA